MNADGDETWRRVESSSSVTERREAAASIDSVGLAEDEEEAPSLIVRVCVSYTI